MTCMALVVLLRLKHVELNGHTLMHGRTAYGVRIRNAAASH